MEVRHGRVNHCFGKEKTSARFCLIALPIAVARAAQCVELCQIQVSTLCKLVRNKPQDRSPAAIKDQIKLNKVNEKVSKADWSNLQKSSAVE